MRAAKPSLKINENKIYKKYLSLVLIVNNLLIFFLIVWNEKYKIKLDKREANLKGNYKLNIESKAYLLTTYLYKILLHSSLPKR